MTSSTLTLAEFLLARIAEDEVVVRVCRISDFVWGPDRIQAECDAKRRIVEFHPADGRFCKTCAEWGDLGGRLPVKAPCPTIKALAAVYADHPGYDPAWAPT